MHGACLGRADIGFHPLHTTYQNDAQGLNPVHHFPKDIPVMALTMPVLETDRLSIRPFQSSDLEAIHTISNQAFGEISLEARRDWLEWTIANERNLANLYQPPYGDRAIILKVDGTLLGSVGLVPCLGPFGLLPYFQSRNKLPAKRFSTPEMGLFWALGSSYRGEGYATEAARALTDYAFQHLGLLRIVATTEHTNTASIAVMQRLGMTIQRNPGHEPAWFQVVGILENPAL
jgi:[ribosomal protein S5]-alanine N-acetyltransferase